MERWTVYKSIAISQLMARNFGQNGGEELDRLNELLDNGQSWFDANRPINDAGAPTTIQTGSSSTTRSWRYSGRGFSQEVIQDIARRRKSLKSLAEGLRLPLKLGSFAVLITTAKSNSGNTMLLGAPQMGPPSADTPSLPHEVELDCPTFHAGGMTVAGIPMVILGHTEHHAWTLTSGISDNIDVYIDSTLDASFSKYFHNNQWLDFKVIADTIRGFINFDDLPAADNTAQNYFVNWNNKPVSWWDNGDNVPWIGSNSVTKIDNFVGPITGFSFANLKDVPRQINDHGTYQQAIEFTAAGIIDENVLPPGQSGFIDLSGQPSPHFADQWPLHIPQNSQPLPAAFHYFKATPL